MRINGLANFITKDPFFDDGLERPTKNGLIAWEAAVAQNVYPDQRQVAQYPIKAGVQDQRNIHAGDGLDGQRCHGSESSSQCEHRAVGADNPAADPLIHTAMNLLIVNDLLNGKNYVVARTGYYERDVVDYSLRNIKGDGSLNYAFRRMRSCRIPIGLPIWTTFISAPTASGSITINCSSTAGFSKQIDSVGEHIINMENTGIPIMPGPCRDIDRTFSPTRNGIQITQTSTRLP